MNIKKPELLEVPHYYPFFIKFFQKEELDWNQRNMERLVCVFISLYLHTPSLAKNDSEEITKFILNSFSIGEENCMPGISKQFESYYKMLMGGGRTYLRMDLINVTWELQRFGECIGIKPVDILGEVHKKATAVLGDMLKTNPVKRFIEQRVITIPLKPTSRDKNVHYVYDLNYDLSTLTQYASSICWHTGNEKTLREFSDYCMNDNPDHTCSGGVEIGSYCDTLIYLRVKELVNNGLPPPHYMEYRMKSESSLPNLSLCIQYVFGMTNVDGPTSLFDYIGEQMRHAYIAELLTNALTTRQLNECKI